MSRVKMHKLQKNLQKSGNKSVHKLFRTACYTMPEYLWNKLLTTSLIELSDLLQVIQVFVDKRT